MAWPRHYITAMRIPALEMIPKNPFSNDFSFRTPDHELVKLDVSQWREVARFKLKQDEFSLYREGEWKGKLKLRGPFVLAKNGEVIVRAQKVSMFRSTFSIDLAGKTCMLKSKSIFSRTFLVLQNDREIGNVRRAHFWSRRTLVDLPADWPVALKVYIFWLVLMMWNRDDAA
jgi:hypothetical protein